jgi:hypothetical protein
MGTSLQLVVNAKRSKRVNDLRVRPVFDRLKLAWSLFPFLQPLWGRDIEQLQEFDDETMTLDGDYGMPIPFRGTCLSYHG